uniref:Uncharacterized protein n=1 Tax=Triticum urartu TaxID=4572 RepID=A0A8R7R2C7_TRIUA
MAVKYSKKGLGPPTEPCTSQNCFRICTSATPNLFTPITPVFSTSALPALHSAPPFARYETAIYRGANGLPHGRPRKLYKSEHRREVRRRRRRRRARLRRRRRRRLVELLEVIPHVEALAVGRAVLRGRRDVGRAGHLREQVPRHPGEERVRPDLVGAAGVPEPPRGIPLQQPRDEVGQLRHPALGVARELDLPVQHVPERLLAVLALERRAAERHLVDEHAHRPPVHGEPVAVAAHHLRRHVLLRADERVRPAPRRAGACGLPAHRGHARRLGLLGQLGSAAVASRQETNQILKLLQLRRRRGRGHGLALGVVASSGGARPAVAVTEDGLHLRRR